MAGCPLFEEPHCWGKVGQPLAQNLVDGLSSGVGIRSGRMVSRPLKPIKEALLCASMCQPCFPTPVSYNAVTLIETVRFRLGKSSTPVQGLTKLSPAIATYQNHIYCNGTCANHILGLEVLLQKPCVYYVLHCITIYTSVC